MLTESHTEISLTDSSVTPAGSLSLHPHSVENEVHDGLVANSESKFSLLKVRRIPNGRRLEGVLQHTDARPGELSSPKMVSTVQEVLNRSVVLASGAVFPRRPMQIDSSHTPRSVDPLQLRVGAITSALSAGQRGGFHNPKQGSHFTLYLN